MHGLHHESILMNAYWGRVQDLRSAVAELKAAPSCCPDGMAPMYGLAAVSPDRSLINEFLIAYQDVLLSGA